MPRPAIAKGAAAKLRKARTTGKAARRTTAVAKSVTKASKVAAKARQRGAATSSRAQRKPRNIDEYLEGVTGAQRFALEAVRRAIRAAAPAAEECISYGLAAFRLDDKVLVGFGATPQHCAFYPMSGSTIAAHQKLLAGFKTTKGSIHFSAEAPLKAAIIKTLTRARITEIRG